MHRYYNRLDATIRKCTREAKEKKCSISIKSNKFVKQVDLTLKEIDLKNQAKEPKHKAGKRTRIKSIKNVGKQNPTWTICKELEMLIIQ